MKNLQNRFAGFTMMELMIAIVIIGLLAALAIPASAMYMERARDAERETSLQTISLGLKNYHSDMNQYPETDNNCVPEVLSGWIEGGVVPTSPSGVLYDEGCGENGRYAYNVSGDKRSYIVAANMERKSRGNSDTDGYKVARFKTSVDHKVEVPNLTEERKGQSFFMMETSEDGIVLIAAPARAQTVASTNAPDLETLPPQTAADDVMTSAPATDDSGNNANPTNSGNNTNTDTNSNPTNSGDTNQNPSTDNSGNNTNTNNTNTNPTNSGNNTNNTNSNSEDNTNAGNDTDTNSNPTNSGDNNSNNNPTDSHIPKQPEVPVPPQPKNCIQEIRANYTIPALDHTKNTTLNFEQNNAKFTVNASCNDGTLTVTEVFSGCKEGYVRKGNENICEIKKTDKEPIFTKPETEKSGNTIKVKKHGIHDDDGVNNIKYTIK